MITKELIFFIRQSKTAGKTNEQIRAALVSTGGWADSDIEEGFRQVALGDNASNLQAKPPVVPTPTPATSPQVSSINPSVNPAAASAGLGRPTPLINFPPSIQGQMINPINQRPMQVARPQAQPMPPQVTKKRGHGVLMFFIFLLLLLGGGGFFFRNSLKTLPVVKDFFPAEEESNLIVPPVTQPVIPVAQTTTPPPVETPTPAPVAPKLLTSTEKINCDGSVQCLIFAAALCTPIPGIVTYSNQPNPLLAGFVQSGQNKYEIKKAAVTKPANNNCVLVSSALSSVMSITDDARKAAVAQGTTEAQLNTTLKTMNDSLKVVSQSTTTCTTTPATLSEYLTDIRDGTGGGIEIKIGGAGTSTQTITTSSGKKFTCNVQPTTATTPPKPTTTP